MSFYSKLQATAGKLLAKYGTSELKIISGTRSYTTSGAFGDLSFTDKMAGNVAGGSQTVTLPGSVPFAPQVGDYIQRGDGVRFVVTRVDATDPAEVPVLYSCVVNR